MTTQLEPKLDRPGAGIPFLQKMVLRFYIGPFIAGKAAADDAEKTFYKLNEKIFSALKDLTENQLTQKVLIPPQRGLEDSSRFWSIAMTLEHMLIVNRAVAGAISQLAAGRIPKKKASTAEVKPLGTVTPEAATQELQSFIKTDFPKFKTLAFNAPKDLHFDHPWFGAFSARQWYWLFGAHTSIHLKQIREIVRGLGAKT